jgi:hypothetical protein
MNGIMSSWMVRPNTASWKACSSFRAIHSAVNVSFEQGSTELRESYHEVRDTLHLSIIVERSLKTSPASHPTA